MLGKTLKRLASVAVVSKLDITPNAVLLYEDEGATIAAYYGTYAACTLRVDEELHLGGISAAVSPQEFADIVALFQDDKEVKAEFGDAYSLVMQQGRRKQTLKRDSRTPPEGQVILAPEWAFTVKQSDFIKEIAAASEIRASTAQVPVLTGIRIVAAKSIQKVGFQASNGSSLVFEAKLDAEVFNDFEVVAPADDLALALRLFQDSTLRVGRMGRRLRIESDHTSVRVGTVQGDWPALSQAARQHKFDESLEMPTAILKALTQAARAYKATNDVRIGPDSEGGIRIETHESELGQFQEWLDGTLSRRYVFDVADLEQAIKILGDTCSLELAPNVASATNGERRLFIRTKVER